MGRREGNAAVVRIALLALSLYYILGSLVDLVAHIQGIVGITSVPSAAVRIAVGGLCLFAAVRVSKTAQ